MTVQQDNATVEQEAHSADPLDEILKFAGEEPDEKEEQPEELSDDEDADEPESDEVEDEGEDEQTDEPLEAIKPPVSLNKEQRAAFEQLAEANPELAKVWAESEAQRNEQVRLKTTEAAEATRNATSAAQAQLAAIQQQYAAELSVYAQAFRPEEPDISLLATDPAAYAQQTAIYKQLSAQYDSLMQQVAQVRGAANQSADIAAQHTIEAERAILREQWPDMLDPAKQADLWNGIIETGEALGFTRDNLANSSAGEMLALRTASEWKDKAAKWDAFQSSKMTKVRAAKNLPRVATPGTAPTRSMSKADKAAVAFQRARQTRSGDDYAAFLEASGISL